MGLFWEDFHREMPSFCLDIPPRYQGLSAPAITHRIATSASVHLGLAYARAF